METQLEMLIFPSPRPSHLPSSLLHSPPSSAGPGPTPSADDSRLSSGPEDPGGGRGAAGFPHASRLQLQARLQWVYKEHAHLHIICKWRRCTVTLQCFSPRRRRRYKVARARAVFPTQGAGLFPKRRACPLQQHRSLLIEKKQVQIHPSCLHSQSLSLYLLLSLSPFGSFPFCLVYFLMYKSSNASDRTFFFQS